MSQIIVENLVKTFRIAQRDAGLWGAVRGVFHRRYHTVRALDGITFSLEAGELVGYIGPNGAGKSTTIKVLAGILVPDSGRCQVLGRIPWQERVANAREIGVVFGQRTQLWWDLPVVESFELLRDIYRVPQAKYKRNLDELAALLQLEPLLDVPVRQLSLGQRMRCELAASLLHSPAILYLDEPTIGLDAVSKLAVRDFVRQLNHERGITVLLTTHDMDDIEALCHRVILIHQGHILFDGPLSALRARVSNERRLTLELAEREVQIEDPDATLIRREGNLVYLRFDPQRVPVATLIGRLTARYAVRDLYVENLPIEEVIARLYGELSNEAILGDLERSLSHTAPI